MPLQIACGVAGQGRISLVKFLLDVSEAMNIDVEKKHPSGVTAEDIAKSNRFKKICKLFLEKKEKENKSCIIF